MRARPRLAVLISGRGSNLAALVRAVQQRRLRAAIALVVSNNPRAPGLEVARAAGVPSAVVDHRAYDARAAFEAALSARLEPEQPDLIVLAGFMRILTAGFVQRWCNRLVNIHPSLLPKYPGRDTHRRVLEAGDALHGASVHLVCEAVDAGAVLGRAVLRVKPGEDSCGLAARVLALEHRLYPAVLEALLSGGYLTAAGVDTAALQHRLPLVELHEVD